MACLRQLSRPLPSWLILIEWRFRIESQDRAMSFPGQTMSRQRSHAVRKSSATSSVAETNWNGNVVLLLGSRMERVGERLSIRSADAGDVVPANLGMQGRRAGARLGEETEGVTVGPKRDHERSVL